MSDSIGKKLRSTLLKLDLRIVNAQAEMKIAQKDYKLYSKTKNSVKQKQALESKIVRDSYKVYIDELKKVKEQILKDIEKVLSRYTPRFKTIWSMYFIQEYTPQEIAQAMNLKDEQVKKIITKLKLDLGEYYKGE